MDDPSTHVTRSGDAGVASPLSSPGLSARPLFLWLAIQLLALLVPALRVPLAAKYPSPAELSAVAVMLAAQVGAGSLLFPTLMSGRRTAAAVIATVWPFQTLAALLAAVPPSHVVLPGAYVTAWLASLALWRAALPSASARLWGVGVASTASLGGAALWYLRSEWSDGAAEAPWFGPLIFTVATPPDARAPLFGWIWPLGSVVTAVVIAASLQVMNRRAARSG